MCYKTHYFFYNQSKERIKNEYFFGNRTITGKREYSNICKKYKKFPLNPLFSNFFTVGNDAADLHAKATEISKTIAYNSNATLISVW